ncbi:hypothetical protein V6N11_011156 [Hibiscus sabdariffa]|uniref:Uncharacterized protein n=1 Tax=Hibiscus sabdariffa TaxID=183260 RepID=A0ABR2S7S9_9ROSI
MKKKTCIDVYFYKVRIERLGQVHSGLAGPQPDLLFEERGPGAVESWRFLQQKMSLDEFVGDNTERRRQVAPAFQVRWRKQFQGSTLNTFTSSISGILTEYWIVHP